ncbi:MAG: hypothetical protein HY862_19960 [Chloroflexi bacterium]|nr:hypothetical protein [Chloroflexota bacterium]
MLFGNPSNQQETDKALANICEDLKPILERELAAGNRVLSCSLFDDLDNYTRSYVLIQLGRRMILNHEPLPEHLKHILTADAHYWWSEIACTKHDHLIIDSFSI